MPTKKTVKTDVSSHQKKGTSKININQKVVGPCSLKHILICVVACIVVYFFVETVFPKVVPCVESAPAKMCACVRHSVSKNVSFFNKIRMLIVGVDKAEMVSYVDASDLIRCAVSGRK